MAEPIDSLSCNDLSNVSYSGDDKEGRAAYPSAGASQSSGAAQSSGGTGGDSGAFVASLPEPEAWTTSLVVRGLVDRYSASSLPSRRAPAVTSGRPPHDAGLYMSSKPTLDGTSCRDEVALANAHVEGGAFQATGVEALGVSLMTGKDFDLQLFTVRNTLALAGGGFGLSLSTSGPELRANLSEHNDDGSMGGNIGIGAQAFGAEATVSTPIGSMTYGMSSSWGASGSTGVGDADHDGDPEFCAKLSIPAYTVGACLEQFW